MIIRQKHDFDHHICIVTGLTILTAIPPKQQICGNEKTQIMKHLTLHIITCLITTKNQLTVIELQFAIQPFANFYALLVS